MSVCDRLNGHRCDRCGSDRLGSLCHGCQNIVCACEPCPVCSDAQAEDFYRHDPQVGSLNYEPDPEDEDLYENQDLEF